MANIASAEKQNRKMIKHRTRNRAAMGTLRTAVKSARTAVDGKTAEAAALTPIDPAINVALYNHTDMVSADDSLAGQVTPGQPGASAVSDTLIDWMLARARGRGRTPSPAELGVHRVR